MEKIAIFYDIENFDDKEEMLNFVQNKFNRLSYKIGIQRAYSDWGLENSELKNEMLKRDITPIHVISHGSRKFNSYSNAADIGMAVDIMDVLHTHPSVDTFVIVSGDGGMINILNKLREHYKNTVSISAKDSASKHISTYSDHYYIIEDELAKEEPIGKNQILNKGSACFTIEKIDDIALMSEEMD